MFTHQPVVLDTCVIINLLATNRVSEIVRTLAPRCLICSAVSGESLYLRSMQADQGPEVVDLKQLFDEGAFEKCEIQGDQEEAFYVGYALELDDGEAMSLAIAQSRNFSLATDERKARRVLRENAAGLTVISTTEIVHAWGKDQLEQDLITAIHLIRERARFQPPDSDPLARWWNMLLQKRDL